MGLKAGISWPESNAASITVGWDHRVSRGRDLAVEQKWYRELLNAILMQIRLAVE